MSGMNGFSMFAEQYRKMAAEGKISQEEADSTGARLLTLGKTPSGRHAPSQPV